MSLLCFEIGASERLVCLFIRSRCVKEKTLDDDDDVGEKAAETPMIDLIAFSFIFSLFVLIILILEWVFLMKLSAFDDKNLAFNFLSVSGEQSSPSVA